MTLKVRVIAGAILIFAALTYLFAWSPLFSVRSISTVGAPKAVSESSLIAKSKIVVGDKLSRIEPRSIERSLSELSWVSSASVDRNWIKGRVTITIVSRIPVGIYKGKAIDTSGTLFELPGSNPPGLPVVSAASPELGLEAISLFTNLPTDIRQATITVSASNANSISSWQDQGDRRIKIMWGSATDMNLKVTVLKALLALPENQRISRVDLSAPHAPIVK
jgi:cell division septal protein FtsQ